MSERRIHGNSGRIEIFGNEYEIHKWDAIIRHREQAIGTAIAKSNLAGTIAFNMRLDAIPYRADLPPRPPEIMRLPLCRGYPVPNFVSWIDGVPEFRVVDARKFMPAIEQKLCWICGGKLNNRASFLIGPMCTVNRISSEPPSHPSCASYAAVACPFLSRPDMVRRENALPEGTEDAPGVMIRRNPGVIALWTTRIPGYKLIDGGNGPLFRIWPPTQVEWYCRGRIATRDEVLEAVDSGLPSLQEHVQDGEDNELLDRMLHAASQFYPK